MTRTAAPAIRTERLSKSFGDTVALSSLDLEAAPGEVIGYLGPNGAGKTTTIRLLLGLIRATSGRAEIFGVDCQADPVAAHRRVAFAPGEVNLWPALTGTETLHLLGRGPGARRHRLPRHPPRTVRVRPVEEGQGVLQGQPPKAHPHRRPDDESGPPAARRADQRSRPVDGAGLPRLRRRGPPARSDGAPLVPHPERGRGGLRRIAILRAGVLVEVGTLDEMRHLSALHVEAEMDGSVPDLRPGARDLWPYCGPAPRPTIVAGRWFPPRYERK